MTVDLDKLIALSTTVQERLSKFNKPEKTSKRGIEAWKSQNIRAGAAATAVYLYEDIGDWGISAMDLVEVINQITGPIDLHVNSNGGSVKDGIAMYNAIKNHPSYFTGIVDGFAASAASVVILACDVVMMEKTSRMMVHDAGIGGMYIEGNATQFRDAVKEVEQMANLLDDLSNMIAQVYVDKAGGTVEDWRNIMSSDTWFSAEQAVEKGLADGIVGNTEGDTSNTSNTSNKNTKTPVKATASPHDDQPTTWDVEGLRNALKEAFA